MVGEEDRNGLRVGLSFSSSIKSDSICSFWEGVAMRPRFVWVARDKIWDLS